MDRNKRLEEIYDRHSNALYAFLINFSRDEDLTYESIQEVFRKIAQRPEILDQILNERAFLIRLAHRQTIDLIRRNQTAQRYRTQFAEQHSNPFATTLDPDESAFRQALADGLQALPAEQRIVVHLKLWEQFTFEEIATSLEIPPNTAASRYRYGIDKLRTLLRPLYNEIQ